MKQKLFMLLAVILLGSASAFAQSGSDTPIKGDVNGDGVVDIADIAAVIDIIKNNQGPTTYYWYVGHVSGSNMTDKTYLTNLVNGKNSTTSTTGPSTLTMPTTSGEVLLYIYPTIWGTPTITYETYGTGDDTFENHADLTPPNGYNITFWDGDSSVRGKTLSITWTK